MRLLLRPEIARQMGIVLLKPGNDLMGVFAQGRVLVEEAPANMAHLPSGRIPDARQPLAEDHLLRPFFTDERVIRAAGGLAALEHWLLLRTDVCQYPHASYHHHELVTMRHPPGALAVCWHCDNELRQQTTEQLAELARENVIAWVIDTVLASLGYNRERELSVAELCWWAVSAGIAGAINEEMAQRALRLPSEPEPTVYRESDIVPALPATSILENRLDGYSVEPDWQEHPLGQPLVSVAVEPEAPATFFARPKRIRWTNPAFIKWVKTQPCVCCGKPSDDPHHLIGWGQGGTATKAHDIFTLPLCRRHHDQLHHDRIKFEQEFGLQPVLIVQLLDRAFALGVLA
ncbi:DUF968 domain-containing protein [Kluyvera sp. Awk 3]|uniref:DUF968 domain-containing protein n=1 Tax=Kluyvera sp. Awk 3 TaxID=2963956 RepID=UPI002302DEB7|nr:DUF968 domain-containing protein [Kluyvera sp. Awk 3]MDA8487462.1 DUF968 domain-containing protein [Kluyvera sp. Awk 3]